LHPGFDIRTYASTALASVMQVEWEHLHRRDPSPE